MRAILFIKVAVLIAALSGVIYVMTHMNSEAIAKGLAAFGIETGTAQSPGLVAAGRAAEAGEERLNICPNRVRSISFISGGNSVTEVKGPNGRQQWVLVTALPETLTELTYMEIEKWLSLHCQIVIRKRDDLANLQSRSSTEPIEILYIDGTKKRFTRARGEIQFESDTLHFDSLDFAEALDELKRIAQIQ